MNLPSESHATQIADFISLQSKRFPNDPAVVFPQGRDAGERIAYCHLTFAQLATATNDWAHRLQAFGISQGTRVALMLRPSLDFFVLTFALFRVGAVPVMIDPGIGRHHLKKCLKKAAPTAFIGIPLAQIARILFGWQGGGWQQILTVGGAYGFGGTTIHQLRKRPATKDPLPQVAPHDQAAILFTSGSTGTPKGVVYQHQQFMAQVTALNDLYQFQHREWDLCTFPLFALFAPALGMTAVIPTMDFTKPGAVNPWRLKEALSDFPITNMFGSPALLKVFAQAAEDHNWQFPLLKRVVSAGAPVPYQTLQKLREHLAPATPIYTPYGATEALPVANISSHCILEETAQATRAGRGICVGTPAPGITAGVMAITEEPLANATQIAWLPAGTIGEIVVKGPQVTTSYFDDPAATKLAKIATLEANGAAASHGTARDPQLYWHRMGDVGYTDEAGRLWYCGRKSQRLTMPHGTMFTIPCEGIFNQHPQVARSALVKAGSRAIMCIELLGGSKPAAALIQDLWHLGQSNPITRPIEGFYFCKSFPVDIRHNAKIFREKLAVMAHKGPIHTPIVRSQLPAAKTTGALEEVPHG